MLACLCAVVVTGTMIRSVSARVCVCHTESSDMAASLAFCFVNTDFA